MQAQVKLAEMTTVLPPMASPLWSEHRQDPSFLWPISAIAALSLHSVVGWWMLQTRHQDQTSQPAVIEVVALPTPRQPARQVTPLREEVLSDKDGTTSTESLPASQAARSTVEPTTTETSLTNIATVAPQLVSADANPARQAPAPTNSSSPSENPAAAPSANPSPATATTNPGLQTWWTLRALPEAQSSPEQLPQLSEGWNTLYLSFDQEPCLNGQDWTSLSSVTVGLNVTVEKTGQISQIRLLQPSVNAAYDAAMICAVERLNPTFAPVLNNGEPITSNALLEITGSPRQ